MNFTSRPGAFVFLFIACLGCYSPNETIEPKNIKGATQYTTLAQQPYLKAALEQVGFTKTGKSSRMATAGLEINTDSVAMTRQADSLSYSFTFRTFNTTANSFSNMVLKQINGGYMASVIQIKTDKPLAESDMAAFNGEISKFSLSGDLIGTVKVEGGIPSLTNAGGRTQCTVSSKFIWECSKWITTRHYSPNPTDKDCIEWKLVDIQPVCIEDDPGGTNGGGPPNYSAYLWANGTFVPSDGGGVAGIVGYYQNQTTVCTAPDGGEIIQDGTDPTYCNNVITILPPTPEEMEELMLNALYDIKTDTSLENNQKAKCIYDKLSATNIFREIIHEYEDSQLSLIFKVGDLDSLNANGVTITQAPFTNVTIAIDRDN